MLEDKEEGEPEEETSKAAETLPSPISSLERQRAKRFSPCTSSSASSGEAGASRAAAAAGTRAEDLRHSASLAAPRCVAASRRAG